MSLEAPRAFSDNRFDYYELQQDMGGIVPKGAIFVHDTTDSVYGTISQGCLKLCWTPDGDTYAGKNVALCAGTVVLHPEFINSDMFKLAKAKSFYDESEKIEKIAEEIEEISNRQSELLEEIKKSTDNIKSILYLVRRINGC